MTTQQIVNDIKNYVGQDYYNAWYAGIASDPEDCLFSRHQVNKLNGRWIYRPGDNSQVARDTEIMLHNSGFDGGPGGGDATTTYVYAYRKTPETKQ